MVTVAYEPLWAIGTGVNASAEQVQDMTEFIRGVLTSLSFAEPQVLYGGSVNPENAATLVSDGHVGGSWWAVRRSRRSRSMRSCGPVTTATL